MSKSKLPKEKQGVIFMNRLAVVLKEERITNRALASQIGYEETTVSKWATNAVQPPLATFYRIALLLNRDLPELFVSTKSIPDPDRTRQLRALAKIGEQGKRVGKTKR